MSETEREHTNARMSKIVRHGGLIYHCRQIAIGSPNAKVDIGAQTRETLARVDILLEETGGDRSRMLSALVHLKDMRDFSPVTDAWGAWVPPGAAPAGATVYASLASTSLLSEVSVGAALAGR